MLAKIPELTDELEEILAHQNKPFPHSAWFSDYSIFSGNCVPWHWHHDLEITYVIEGGIKLTTDIGTHTVSEGEAVLINSDVMHLQEQLPGTHTNALCQVFDASILAGKTNSVFEQKYVMPLLNCREIDVLVFSPADGTQRYIIDAIRKAQDVADLQPAGYEILVRNHLSEAWLYIYQQAEARIHAKKVINRSLENRLKPMMSYIHSNYSEKISLEDIAYSANISTREVLRTFKNGIQMTPFQYLTDIRVRSACKQLRETDKSVADIALDCGFGSPSYFGKVFHEQMNTTPVKYRQQIIEQSM